MSGMAEEIIARMGADGADVGAGAAPGTDGGTPAPAQPSAGTSNTAGASSLPETVPYARFKEVNDQFRALEGYQELANFGYDPDSLGRLAAFEAQYMTDPVGTWMALSRDLDLPQEVRDVLAAHTGQPGSGDGTDPASPQPDSGEGERTPSSMAALPPDVQETLRWAAERKQQEADQAQQAAVDGVLKSISDHWDALDKADGFETPENIKMTFISATASQGGFRDAESLAVAARSALMEYRDRELGGVVQGSSRSGTPLAVPGGVPAATEPTKFGGIRDATRQAIADLQAGRLPST